MGDDLEFVGVLSSGYPEKRNILSASSFGVENKLVDDRMAVLHKIWHRITGKGYNGFLHSWAWAASSEVDLVHSFNAVVFGGAPWVVTFETTLPRVGTLPVLLVRLAWRKLANSKCRAILALSECAAERLRTDLKTNRPGVPEGILEAIRQKLCVLHPPQPVLVPIEEKLEGMDWDGPLRLALVGHDFYRKGGLEVLLAMDSLIAEGKDVVLEIAGKMIAGDYASRAGESEIREAEAIMAKHSDRMILRGSIPSEQVHGLLRESHVICLPTWGETYGYSVLEGQASGCAAITTDLRALPEINDSNCGWVIPVPKLANGDGDLDSAEKRLVFRRVLVEGLKESLRSAHDDRVGLRKKADASLQRIREFHDPETHAARLKTIYQREN
jgi:glycosyltransferase involved in cell wall biosynthesis